MYQYKFNSMSTLVRISVSQELFANDLMPIYKLFSSVEDTCSRFKEDSELSRLNLQRGKKVKVSNNLYVILNEALRFYKETEGVFNPGILAAMKQNGYAQSIEYIRGLDIAPLAESNYTALTALKIPPYELNESSQTVLLHTGIDLGGLAKGWAIDRAAEVLTAYGSGFVNVGGDIRIFGELPRPLNIGIEDPENSNQMISDIQVSRGAVATSTTMKRKWKLNGVNKHHLIDTQTGEPSLSNIISATVTAPTALEADVWAKVTLLMGEEQGKEWISSKGSKAVLINQSKEIWKGGQ